MSPKNMAFRYLVFLIGVYIMTFGIVMAIKCFLGTPPIATLTYVFSINSAYSIGIWMFLFNLCLILGQIILLGKSITKKDIIEIILQFPAAFVFSIFLDFNMHCFQNLEPANYIQSFVFLIIGCIIQSLGLSICMKPNVILLSADAFVRVMTIRFNKKFSRSKIAFDISIVAFAMICSFIFASKIQGIREGTVIAACINGYIVGFFNKNLIFCRLHKLH